MRPFLTIDGVSKRYRSCQPLTDCSFSMDRREVLVVRSRPREGATTLAMLLTGLAAPTSGTIRLDGLAPELYRRRYGIGYVPQQVDRWPSTVAQLLEMRGPVRDSPWTAEELVGRLELEKLLHTPIPTLTEGQWRRVLLAYAITGGSSFLVLDAPHAGVDTGWADPINTLIGDVAAGGAAVVVVGGVREGLFRLRHRQVSLRAGTIVPESSFHDPFGTRRLDGSGPTPDGEEPWRAC